MSDASCVHLSFLGVQKALDSIEPKDGLAVNLKFQRPTKLSGLVDGWSLSERRRLICEGLTRVVDHELDHMLDMDELFAKLRSIRAVIGTGDCFGERPDIPPQAVISVTKDLLEAADLASLGEHKQSRLASHLRSVLYLLLN